MDRQEWAEMLGDDITTEADLRWTLFQAERCVETAKREETDFTEEHPAGRHIDREVFQINKRRIRDCKVALAALWNCRL